MTATHRTTKRLVMAALCLALCMVLPFLTGNIPEIGSMLCPMHFPVLLCGFLCGWPWGLAVGAVAPVLRSAWLTMPPMTAAIPMAFEMAVYGAVSGILYRLLPKKPAYLYVSLVSAMIAGRLVWGAVRFVMAGLSDTAFPFSAFLSGAVLTAWPGILAQLVIVPALVLALKKAGLMENG